MTSPTSWLAVASLLLCTGLWLALVAYTNVDMPSAAPGSVPLLDSAAVRPGGPSMMAEDFRRELDAFWERVDREAAELKESDRSLRTRPAPFALSPPCS